MDITRVKKTIDIMKRIPPEKFNIEDWRTLDGVPWRTRFILERKSRKDFDEQSLLAKCGTAACLAGWIAVSPEFKADGGFSNQRTGAPMFPNGYEDIFAPTPVVRIEKGIEAVASWLGIDKDVAEYLCMPERYPPGLTVQPNHVIERLEELLDRD